eukprot:TRINITY_DN23440_c0_g2_i1.p1 TRINITY_DN23440_c0_g2~~TRINITY_DN23440_c0_g2_i1.p1  ORF type:complete len:422 (-),score=28.89 TRINITY_DN23440_c0_g2_i1:229-1494(-)
MPDEPSAHASAKHEYESMVEEDLSSAKLAAATIETRLSSQLFLECSIDTESVYGTALAIPQIARSARWPPLLSALAIRSYLFLVVTVVIQLTLLFMLNKEEYVLNKFAGKMNLCDFTMCDGSDDDCVGPAGTRSTPPRVYNFADWDTRTYVKESLLSLFPDKHDEIQRNVDPGEYGLESNPCRIVCVYVFILAVLADLLHILSMLRTLYKVPSIEQPWLRYVGNASDTDLVHESKVEIKVAGMSVRWKVINLFFVVLPKIVVWKNTTQAGVMFLMETASISNMIVNSAALSCILQLEGMIHAVLCTHATRSIMEKIQAMPVVEPEDITVEAAMKRYDRLSLRIHDLLEYFPVKLLLSVVLSFFFFYDYYMRVCVQTDTGRWVSRPAFTPASTTYNMLHSLFPSFMRPVESEGDPFWTMPQT